MGRHVKHRWEDCGPHNIATANHDPSQQIGWGQNLDATAPATEQIDNKVKQSTD
jgi:hypothetical protein